MKNALWTVAVSALLCASPALAQQADDDAEVTKMAKEHYRLGLDAYKQGKYDVAIKELKKAYLLKRLPALLLNIGATYRKMGDYDLALHFYQKYLEEAPPDARDRDDVNKIIADIKVEKENGGSKSAEASATPSESAPAAAPTPAPPPVQEPAREWSHTPVDAAPPDQPLDVRVATPVMKGVKVYLNYRSAGEENFKTVVMHRRGAEKVGRIPPEAMQGKAVQYYIEAKDAAGTVVKSSGSAVSPNIVMVDPSAPVQIVASSEGGDRGREVEQQQQREEEEQPGRAHRNSEEEEAPITGTVPETHKRREKTAAGPSKFGTLFWAGVGTMAGGVALVGGGIACGVVAQQRANTLSMDSMNPLDSNMNKIYFNNDPNAGGTQEADLASQGKLYNSLGIALDVVGGVAIAGGATMMILDQLVFNKHEERPKKRRVQPPPSEEASSTTRRAWYVAPSASHRFTGVAGGFAF